MPGYKMPKPMKKKKRKRLLMKGVKHYTEWKVHRWFTDIQWDLPFLEEHIHLTVKVFHFKD